MDVTPRLETLNNRIGAIDVALHEEEAHAYHDEARIRTLKVEKLHLKEEMQRLEQAANGNRSKWH
jgi:hypothetical protein